MVYRCILPAWAEKPGTRKVQEGEFDDAKLKELNDQGYNIYFLPNYPSIYDPSTKVDGSHIDTFNFAFVDMDLKDGTWKDKESFILAVGQFKTPPTFIVDSGNGVHAYWQIDDLDAMSYLRLQRRLCRHFKTDEAVSKIYQLMRVPGTLNTKKEGTPVLCDYVSQAKDTYTCEQLSNALPQITHEDEQYCQQHYANTYKTGDKTTVSEEIPAKFAMLHRNSSEVKKIWADSWSGNSEDRSKADYRLGHIMFANGFNKKEAMSVLVNSNKASTRAPAHRVSYAEGIVEKIWTFELPEDDEDALTLSNTVTEVLQKSHNAPKGVRLPCYKYLDATLHGFRLGHVIGLVAGSGVGKTAMALNMFKGFVQNNPDYDHFFIPLEQPANEIADRWKTMCGADTALYDKVHIMSNYADDGTFRHLSFAEIKDYILRFQRVTGKKIGCVVIDHIGALKKTTADGENQGLMDICHEMKAFAINTNTLLVMQSQCNREKAGIGDLELSKDAAYGTVFFESYCDYLITIWQPLKRCYSNKDCPTVTAYKFCKIRHKNKNKDEIQEDTCYRLFFETETEMLSGLTQAEEEKFTWWANQALVARKRDRKTDLVPYKSTSWTKEEKDGKIDSSEDAPAATGT